MILQTLVLWLLYIPIGVIALSSLVGFGILAWKHPKTAGRIIKSFIPLVRLSRRIERIDRRLGYLESLNLDKLWGELRTLNDRVTSVSVSNAYQKNSPLQLKEEGEQVAEKINAVIEKHMKDCLDLVKQERRAYKIQEICFDFTLGELWGMLDNKDRELIQEVGFDHGWDKDIMLRVVGIRMRDKVFSQHNIRVKGINN